MIKITDIAKDKLKDVLKENPDKYLRINFQGSG
jgi:hypothetical protein